MNAAGRSVSRAIVLALVAMLAVGVTACGKKKEQAAATDPVATALQAPGVRTVVIPKQRSGDLTIAVPPCSAAQVDQENTKVPPGSNQLAIPKDSLAQSVAIQPCTSPQSGQPSQTAGTIIVSPGGASGGATGQHQNQLVLPNDSNLKLVIVPPCTQGGGQSPTTSSGGNSVAIPSTGDKQSITAPPCTIQQAPGASSSG